MHVVVLTLGALSTIVWCSTAVVADEAAPEPLSAFLRYSTPRGDVFVTAVRVEKSARGAFFVPCDFGKGILALRDGHGAKFEKRTVYFQIHGAEGLRLLYADRSVRVFRNDDGTPRGFCRLKYDWKENKTYHLAVCAEVDGNTTEYTGWFHAPQRNVWLRLATFSLPTGGHTLGQPWASVQNLDGSTDLHRVQMGPSWMRVDGKWQGIRSARFEDDRKTVTNVDAGPKGAGFFLAIGGNTKHGTTNFGKTMNANAADPPAKLVESLDVQLR